MKDCIVLIPVYKDNLSEYEIISLKRCLSVLRDYDIHIFSYEGLNTPNINKLLHKRKPDILWDYFDKRYFEGIAGYNELMMNAGFYDKYRKDYKYMLIYQLDCYVFENSLSKFTKLGYDYIGAPLPDEFSESISEKFSSAFNQKINTRFFMNGGLSLRKIETFYEVCNEIDERWKKWNEDLLFSIMVPNPADKNVALQFAFECYPKECYEETNHTLPMGCHAWYKCGGGGSGLYDDLFWYKKISRLIYLRKKLRRFLLK